MGTIFDAKSPSFTLGIRPGKPTDPRQHLDGLSARYQVPANLLQAMGEAQGDTEFSGAEDNARAVAAALKGGASMSQALELAAGSPERAQAIKARANALMDATQPQDQRRRPPGESGPSLAGDLARMVGGGLVRGVGGGIEGLGIAAEDATMARKEGQEGEFRRLTRRLGDKVRGAGESPQAGASDQMREAMAGSTPTGDLFAPSTWDMGENPSLRGYAGHAASVLGSLLPVVVTAVATRSPAAAAAAGGAMGGGEGAEQGRQIVMDAADKLDDLGQPVLMSSEVYRRALEGGATHEQAVEATANEAARVGALFQMPVSALGGGLTQKIVAPAERAVGRGVVRGVVGRGALSGVEEGAQEAAESVAAQAGTNRVTGLDDSLTDGTFGDFILGALGGAGPGAVSGAFDGRAAREQDQSAGAGAAGQADAPGPQPDDSGQGPTLALPPPPRALPAPPLGLPAPTETPDSAQGRAPDGAAVPSPNPQQAGGGTAQPAIGQFRPAGLLESLATTMPPPPTAPVEAPAPLFPDMKPGAAVELGGPMGVTMPAVFLREEGGNVVVRIEGREVPFTPAEFDASRQAAVVAREQAESGRQTPLVSTDEPQAAASQQMEPAHVEPASPVDAVAGGLSAGPVRVDDVRQDSGQGAATGRVDRPQGAQGNAALDAGRGRADPAEDRQGDLGGLDVADGAGNLDGAVTPAPSEADHLRERLAFLKRLGRTNGWNSRMSRAREDVERELRRIEGPAPSIARVRGRARAAVLRDWNEAEPPTVDGVTLKHDSAAGGWIFPRAKEAAVREALGIPEAPPANVPTPEDMRTVAAEVDTAPTDAQKEAGNYRMAHIGWNGLGLTIETPKGATRSGTDRGGKAWSVEMPADYGYIKRTEGADGDHLDIYMGPQPDAGQVFVVDQVDAETGAFDEHKVMLGFPDRESALSAYRAGFSDGKGDARMGGVTEMAAEQFRDAARDGDWSQPLAKPEAVPDAAAHPSPAQAESAGVSTKSTDFVQAPDGGIDFGEIGADVARAIGRQPGPIRLREGDEQSGLRHIKARHESHILDLGYPSVEAFVAKVAGDFRAIFPRTGRALDLVLDDGDRGLLIVQLEPDAHGDFYDVRTATPIRSGQYSRKVPLWEMAGPSVSPADAGPLDPKGQSTSEDSASAPGNQSSRTPEVPASKIEDFGETLEGARKHVWAAYADTLKSAEEADVASVPLSKSWPAPDYQKLIEAGVEPWKVAFIRAARDTIPTKPQKAWRLKGWVEAVEAMRGLAADVLDGQHDAESLRAHLRRNGGAGATILGQMDLYEVVGHAISLKGMNLHRVEYTMLAGVRFDPPRAFWEIDQKAKATGFSNMPKTIARAETREEAIEAFKKKHADMAKAEAAAPATKQRKFVAYRHDGGKYFSVGTKIGSRYIQLRRTDSVKEARRIIAEEHEALQAQFDAMREIPADRRSENAPRVGIDHRSGVDVTPEQFGEAFGFRGVQFGNWVEGGRRQQDLNDAFDALMDLAGVLDLPPRALSLHGTLGLAFGARGRGGVSPASAHYEPGQVVINLTKTSGAGSLAHEWFHALDNYFARRIEARMGVATKGLEYVSDNSTPGKDIDGVRPEVVDAFLVLKRALGATGLAARSKNIDQMRAKPYWATGIEMHARAFESYVIAKLQDQSIANDYLANIVDGVAWQMRAELSGLGDSYPYLTESELETVRPAFDGLFETIETREAEQGVELYQHEMEEGPFGPVIGGYEGDWRGAALALEEMQAGEAPGALSHPEIGPIALVWGKEGTRRSDGYGLSKLIAWHPEILDDLQGHLSEMQVISRSDNRIQLESAKNRAGVRLDWDGKQGVWLIGAYVKGAPRLAEKFTGTLADLWGDMTPQPRRGKAYNTTDFDVGKERREANGFSSPRFPEQASVDTRAMRGLAETVSGILAAHGLRGGVTAKVVRTLMTTSGVRVLGAYRKGTISVNATASRPGHVVRHEIIHALRDAALWGKPYGLFNRQEWLALVRAARKDPAISARVAEHYGDASATVQTEEMVAELYADWATRRAEAPPGALGAALERIQSFFRAIAAALRGEGFIDAAAVMRRIERGEIGARGENVAASTEGEARYQSVQTAPVQIDPETKVHVIDMGGAVPTTVDWRGEREWLRDNLQGKEFLASDGIPVRISGISKKLTSSNTGNPAKQVAIRNLPRLIENAVVYSREADDRGRDNLSYAYAAAVARIGGEDYSVSLSYRVDGEGKRAAYQLLGYEMEKRPGGSSGDLAEASSDQPTPGRSHKISDVVSDFNRGSRPVFQRDMGETAAAQLRATGSWADGMLGKSGWLSPAQWPERISNKMTDMMGRTPSMAGLALVPGRALFTELGRNIRAAGIYQRLKEEMDAQRNEWQAKAADVAKAWSIQRGRYPKENEAMMDLMHEATLEQVDPAQPFESSERAAWAEDIVRRGIIGGARKVAQDIIERDRVRKVAYDRLRLRYEALPNGLKGIYRTVRDSYTRLADEVDAAVLDSVKVATEIAVKRAERAHAADLRRITEEGLKGTERATAIALADKRRDDAKTRARANAEKRSSGLRAAFEANRKAGPYFPLARFGRYFVAIKDAEGKVTSFSRFDSRNAAADFAKDAKARDAGRVEEGIVGEADIKGMVDPQFVAEVERIMADAGTSEETMDAVWQAWLSTLPDQSIRKNRIHRKGRAGYDADAYRAFGKQMFHGAHQLARLKHGMRMEDALNDAEEQAKRMDDPARAGFVVEEMRRRHAFTMNPTGSAAASTLTGIGFIWYLGMTPAAALVNISQTTMLGVPMMAQRYKKAGVTGAIRALTGATRDFAAGKGKAENSSRLTADEKAAMVEAYRRGTVDKTQSHDLAGVAESGVEHNVRREKIMAAFAFMFHHAERLNRETTFLAAYRLAREQGLDHEAAIEDASHLTWKAHFSYANNDRPRVIQNDFAKVLLLFRQYTINMLWRLFRDAHQSFAGATKEDRAEARTQLIGISLSMMAHAGIKGVWGYAIIMSMLGVFFPGGDDDAERWLQDALLLEGDGMGTAAWNWIMGAALIGVPGKVTGADVSGRIGMPELWFRDSGRDLDGQDAWRATLEDLAGPVFGIAGGFAKALGSMGEDPWRATEAAMPKFARDLMKTGRYAGEGVLTWNGDPVVENVSIRELAMQAIGITPGRLAAQYEANNRMRNENDRISAEKKRLHRKLGDALSSGNGIDADLREALLDFNRAYPFDPITTQTLRQSMQGRLRASQRNEGGVGFTPKRDAYLRSREGQLVW